MDIPINMIDDESPLNINEIENILENDSFSQIERTHGKDGSVIIQATLGENNLEFYFKPEVTDLEGAVEVGYQYGPKTSIPYSSDVIQKLYSDSGKEGVSDGKNLVVYMENTAGSIVTSVKNNLGDILNRN